MKKLLITILSVALLLGACGQKEESSTKEDTKDTKKEIEKKEPKKKETTKKSEPKTEEQSTQETTSIEQPTEEVNTTEQTTQEQTPTKDEMAQKFKNGENVNGQVDAEGNTYVQAPGGGDAMGYYKPDGSFCTVGGCVSPEAQERMDREMEESEDTFDYENNGVYRTPSEQVAHENWVNGQDEWNNASEAEKENIRRRDAEQYGYEYDPSDYE
ncbi:hypothetical protein [Mammaliicoccus fleurettii]|uniref:hypothetical protein n=1 Tax=Mammaliicoccus fleurettii TaxID=150056 RepID=UPI000992EE39|nr:hypothetical protein [Mammaliicoccus fleurettii]MBO3062776.1 hypothetical protein [Mammaliicoccus fleurettii]OOV78853.1 hypothetical protein B2G86_00575 [Mammaliicoccus fleurettii]